MGKISKNEKLSRRNFLRYAALGGGLAVVSGSHLVCIGKALAEQAEATAVIRLNPGFRIRDISKRKIQLYTHKENGQVLSHHFENMTADLLRGIGQEHSFDLILNDLTEKYRMPEKECRRQVMDLLQQLEKRKLIYYGEKMLVKIVEVGHAGKI